MPFKSKYTHYSYQTPQKDSASPTNLGQQYRLNDPPDLKKVVEKYLRDGDQVTLEGYLNWIHSLHPSAMQAYLKGLLNLGIKLKAKEMLAYALYHGLQGGYYSVQDIFEALAQIDLGIMDMINGTTVQGISFLLAYILKDGVVTPMQIEWLVHHYRAHDPDATSRLVGSMVSKLWHIVSPPEFFAVMQYINLHTLFNATSKESVAFELAKFVDPILVEKLL
ncbi:hypothetical protein HMI54_010609 [Coelomomyces lativittatus]|nr:hypothetical protein HMI54_010609 [Coelomomyces lativittatus]